MMSSKLRITLFLFLICSISIITCESDKEQLDDIDEAESHEEDDYYEEYETEERKKRNVQIEKDVTFNTGNGYQTGNTYQSSGYSSYPQNYGYSGRPRPGAAYNVPQSRPHRQCTETGMPCTNGTVCCTDVCEPMPRANQPRRCCLSEGLICDNSAPGNGGLLPCCNGLFCDQLSTLPQLTVCQERLYKFEQSG